MVGHHHRLTMDRIALIPTRTADGRHIVLRAVVLTLAQRLRRLAVRLGLSSR
jgi:hypothetical protein